VGGHARDQAAGLAIDLEDLVEEQRLGAVGTVGNELRIQHLGRMLGQKAARIKLPRTPRPA
jgi:hypothetical protein